MPVPHDFSVKRQDVAGGERHGSRIGGLDLRREFWAYIRLLVVTYENIELDGEGA